MRTLIVAASLGLLTLISGCTTDTGGFYGMMAPGNYDYGPSVGGGDHHRFRQHFGFAHTGHVGHGHEHGGHGGHGKF